MVISWFIMAPLMFQHTAARRRLRVCQVELDIRFNVSTHSRAEAAALGINIGLKQNYVSTHSRAEAAALMF